MNSEIAVPQAQTAGHPIVRTLVSFPIACFVSALVTDLAYVKTANMLWADFSAWLLALGMAMGVLAALAGLIALIRTRRTGARRPVWTAALGGVAVLAVAFVNNLVHSRDAWTSVMPLGLTLSAVTVVLMLITVWLASARPRPTLSYARVPQ